GDAAAGRRSETPRPPRHPRSAARADVLMGAGGARDVEGLPRDRDRRDRRNLASPGGLSLFDILMADVLFGQAYFLRFDPKLWDAQQPYAPLGTLYAAAAVRERGYSVALFDAMLAESEAEWSFNLALHRPRFAVIYEDSFNYLSKMCLLRMRQAAMTMIAS